MNLKNQWNCCGRHSTQDVKTATEDCEANTAGNGFADGDRAHAVEDEQKAAGYNTVEWRQAIIQANWRVVGTLTLSVTCIAFGIFVLIHGFDMLRHLWVLGPILIMCGLAIMVTACFIKKKPADEDMLSEKYSSIGR
ncbi:hypothetical protein CHUAL_008557 [Chamberlinius hualienensis]